MKERKQKEIFVLEGLPQAVFDFMKTTVMEEYGGPEAFPLGRADWDKEKQKYLESKGWQFTFEASAPTFGTTRYTVIAKNPKGKSFKFAQGWQKPISLDV